MTAADPRTDPDRPSTPQEPVVARLREAIAYCAVPARLRRTTTIALVVGTILTLLNQGDVILGGNATGMTAIRAGLNFVVPFLVSNLGLLSGRVASVTTDTSGTTAADYRISR
jgi:hypothetical protein